MARYAIIDKNNVVVNVIMYHGGNWKPPQNQIMVRSDIADVGNVYIPLTNDFDKSNQELPFIPEPQPLAQPWLQFTGAARLGANQ